MPTFEPISTAHSIERCTLAFTFSQELPSKVLGRALEQSAAAFRNAGLEREAIPGYQIDFSQGRMVPITSGGGPAKFTSPDQSTSVLFQPNAIIMQTGVYVRWAPFIGQVEELVLPIVRQYCDSLNLISIQLEYLDTFFWGGSWDDFQWRDLLDEGSGFICSAASRAPKHWHSHSGWFEFPQENVRRLRRAHIDIVERLQGENVGPAITIVTTLKDEAFAELGQSVTSSIDVEAVKPTLEALHTELKVLIKRLLKKEMADRIGV